MLKTLISNTNFGQASPQALQKLSAHFIVEQNLSQNKLTESELITKGRDADILIAGTEKITATVIDNCPNLKLIARVGVGVDSIDLEAARAKGIRICYTPEAPTEGVAELGLSLILSLIKGIHASDRMLHQGRWFRPEGRLLQDMTFGFLGFGRIGKRLFALLKSLSPVLKCLYCDPAVELIEGAQKVTIERLFQDSDVVSIHLPYTQGTKHLVDKRLLVSMKEGSYLLNTSRGGIVQEDALCEALQTNHLAGAALDVFEREPYNGPLCNSDNCLLTAHIGSLARETRALMENQVTEDIVSFIKTGTLHREFKL